MSILHNAYDYLPLLKKNNFRAPCGNISTYDFFRYFIYSLKMWNYTTLFLVKAEINKKGVWNSMFFGAIYGLNKHCKGRQ